MPASKHTKKVRGRPKLARQWATLHSVNSKPLTGRQLSAWNCRLTRTAKRLAIDPSRKCSVDGCGFLKKAHGLCKDHYAEQRPRLDALKRRAPLFVNQASAAYMAGIIDGEGSICLLKGKSRWGTYVQPRVNVYNNSVALMQWIVEVFGGTFTKVKRRQPKWVEGYVWTMNSSDTRFYMDVLRPFLIIKRRNAELVVEFYSVGRRYGRGRNNKVILEKQLALVNEIRKENLKSRARREAHQESEESEVA